MLSRRQFLGATLAGSAAYAAGAFVPATALPAALWARNS